MLIFTPPIMVVPFGLVVRIPGFHPGSPGLDPWNGNYIFCILLFSECDVKGL